jgi:uncharacterized membrane protein YbaN (DUF454 family)
MKPVELVDNLKRLEDPNLVADDGEDRVQPTSWFGKRWLFLLAGLICVALAAAGAILPVLPCTPFLLLAAYCFARSSKRMHRWLLHSRLFGPIIQDWQQHRAIRRRVRTSSVLLILVVIGLTFAIVRPTMLIGATILALVGVGLVVIFRLPIRD